MLSYLTLYHLTPHHTTPHQHHNTSFVLYCIVLYFIVLCCVVLCCAVLCCAVLCCVAPHCTGMHCIISYCIVLYRIVLYCIALYHTSLYHGTMHFYPMYGAFLPLVRHFFAMNQLYQQSWNLGILSISWQFYHHIRFLKIQFVNSHLRWLSISIPKCTLSVPCQLPPVTTMSTNSLGDWRTIHCYLHTKIQQSETGHHCSPVHMSHIKFRMLAGHW